MEIKTLIDNLRKRIEEYKSNQLYNSKVLKQDILSIEIAISLLELYVYCGRKIEESEKYWFKGGYYIANDITGEWEDISKMYDEIVRISKGQNLL